MRHVIDAGTNVDQRFEHRMHGDIGDALTVDPDPAAVTNGIPILLARANHLSVHPLSQSPGGSPMFCRNVVPSYSIRNSPRSRSSGMTSSTKSFRPPGRVDG